MGIFDALNTSVSGLQAQSFALQNISGNIANASTTGYKGTGTSFEDLVPQSTTADQQAAGGVRAHAQATITTQGTVSATAVCDQHGDQRRRAFSTCRSRSALSTTCRYSTA